MRFFGKIGILMAVLAACIPLQAQQWAVFSIIPRNAMLTVDGKRNMLIRDGFAQVFLDAGTHRWICESPFYETASGEFEINGDNRVEIRVNLAPAFGTLKVMTQDKNALIYIDGRCAGKGSVDSGKLGSGEHSVMLVRDTLCLYRAVVTLEAGEKKNISISARDYEIIPLRLILSPSGVSMASFISRDGSADEPASVRGKGDLNVSADIKGVRVLVNGVQKGNTPCIVKELAAGQTYRVTLRLEGYQDYTEMVRMEEGKTFEMNVKMKKK